MEHSLCFPCTRISPYRGEPLTGEPDAGDPPVRFGGRGERNQSFLPTPILPMVSPQFSSVLFIEGSAVGELSSAFRGYKKTSSDQSSGRIPASMRLGESCGVERESISNTSSYDFWHWPIFQSRVPPLTGSY